MPTDRHLTVLVVVALLLPSMAMATEAEMRTGSGQSNQSTASSSVIQIDPSTSIESMTWGQEGVTLIFESRVPRQAMLTDVYSVTSSGASEVNFKRTQLTAGRTEVYMPATSRRGDQSVTVMVGDTMIAVSDPSKPFLTDVQPRHVLLGAIIGGVTILGMMVVKYRQKRRKDKGGARPLWRF